MRPSAREPNNGSARFHPLPKGARGLSGAAQRTGAKQRLSAVFTLSPKGRGDCPVRPSAREPNNGSARFSPSPQRGEGTVRCGPVHGSQTTAQRGFTLSLKGREDCPVRPSAREPNNGSARFSLSPKRGEGTVRCGPVHGSQTTAPRGFHPLPFGERAGVRGKLNAPALHNPAVNNRQ